MMTYIFPLTDDGRVELRAYIQDDPGILPVAKKRPAVLVCAGGGYEGVSPRESDPVALGYLGKGFHAFTLRYSVGRDAAYPNSLTDLSRAVKLIRAHSGEWHLDPEKIAVCGFSAGGHLVASLGTKWNAPEIMEAADCHQGENKPNALVLGYPVITGGEYAHRGSFDMLIQNIADQEERERMNDYLSCEKHVGKHTPPVFLFHTYFDSGVPVENALLFGSALAKQKVPFEMHIFEYGEHGMSLCNHLSYESMPNLNRDAEAWFDLSANWLWNLFGRCIDR